MDVGSLVVAHLVSPSEKFWGILERLAPEGVTLRALNLDSFEDWLRAAARGESQALGLSTVFFPMHRVERIFLDEQVGEVESLAQRFEREVGLSVEEYLGRSTVN
jgi:hypothetical protein